MLRDYANDPAKLAIARSMAQMAAITDSARASYAACTDSPDQCSLTLTQAIANAQSVGYAQSQAAGNNVDYTMYNPATGNAGCMNNPSFVNYRPPMPPSYHEQSATHTFVSTLGS